MRRRKLLFFLFLGLTIVGGLIIALISVFGSTHRSKTSTKSNTNEKDAPFDEEKALKEELNKQVQKAKQKTSSHEAKIYTDPTKETYSLNLLAIGDWGSTLTKIKSSCCNRYRIYEPTSPEYMKDMWAQDNIAKLMAMTIRTLSSKPLGIIGHGDNFYWNGVGTRDRDLRFKKTFEEKYSDPAFANIPWINVMGNHDYGGDGYICGDEDNQWRPCKSLDELIESLEQRFQNQATYKSPNSNRWIMPQHYYKYGISSGNLSVDIYNVDTNIAASHGARQICCQCYGYSQGEGNGVTCTNVDRGHPYCLGGNTDWYDACIAKIKSWYETSLTGLEKDAGQSKADYKLVNSHYSPTYHFTPEMQLKWYEVLQKHKIQVFMNGHTHAESHDYGLWEGTHFFENGAGGGIQSESPAVPNESASQYVKSLWTGGNYPYGFFVLKFSRNWIRVEFITFDDRWVWARELENVKVGGAKMDHCWYIPKDGSEGREC